MVTALALYTGRTLTEFELVGLTTDAQIVGKVLELIAEHDAHLLHKAGYRRGRRPAPLHVVGGSGAREKI